MRNFTKLTCNGLNKRFLKQAVLTFGGLMLFGLSGFAQTKNTSPYCSSTGSCDYFNGLLTVAAIDDVQIGNLSNTGTGCNADGTSQNTGSAYNDNNTYFNNLPPINAAPGETISGTVTTIGGQNAPSNVKVWIDLNQDSTFTTNELVYTSPTTQATHNFQITIPDDAKCGITRLRVMSVRFLIPNDPCLMTQGQSGPEWGEAEDYDINISPEGKVNDLSLSLNAPTKNQSKYQIEPLSVRLTNASKQKITGGKTIPIKYRSEPGQAPQTFNYNLSSDLSLCESVTVPLDTLNLACQQVYKLEAWSAFSNDPTPGNDSASLRLDKRKDVTVFEEGFEGGSSSRFSLSNNGGRALITSDNTIAGPAHTDDYHLVLHDGGRPYAQTTVNFSKGVGEYFLDFWWKHAYDEACDPGDGVFVSTDGGRTFTRIRELCIFGTYDFWYPFTINLEEAMRAKGLNPTGKVIVRLASRNRANYDGSGNTNGEGVAYDDIEVYRKRPNQLNKPSNISINVPDTVFLNSPTRISAGFRNSEDFLINWYFQGNEIASDTSRFLDTFTTQTTGQIAMEVAGCFGIDTIRKTITVERPNQAPVADFISQQNIIDPSDSIRFKNLTTGGATNFEWYILPATNTKGVPNFIWNQRPFNNRVRSSFEPSARFINAGVYDVRLVGINSLGRDTVVKKDYIRVRDYHDICSDNSDTDTIGTLRDGEGTYPSGANCTYLIQPCADEIELNLSQLDLKQGDAYLRIYDGADNQGEPLWDVNAYGSRGLTGDTTNPDFEQRLTATSGSVYVEFSSGQNPEGAGFQLGWNANTSSLSPLSAAIQGDTAVCQNQTAAFEVQTNAVNSTYEWYLNKKPEDGSPDARGSRFAPRIADAQNDTLRVVVSNCGRQQTLTQVITPQLITTKPQVGFTAGRKIASTGDTIQLTETTESCITSRNWGIAPNTFNFVNGTDAGSQNPEVVFNANGVYTVSLTDTTNGGAVASETKSGYIIIRDYCTPGVLNLNGDIGVSRFQLRSIDNRSPVASEAYTDYTGETPSANLEKGGRIPFRIERNTSLNPISYRVWIDFNRDGDFTDAGETVYAVDGYSGTVVSDSLTVPSNVSFGAYRLRVGANLNQQPNQACGPNRYGEYEDYRVQVIPDQKAPVVLRRGGDTVQLGACNSANRFIRSAFARDIVDGRITNLQIQGSVDTASPGFYSIDYSVTDSRGNDTTFSQVFEVLPDNQGPSFQLNGPSTYQLGVNQPYVEPGYSNLMDNCAVSGLTVDSSGLDRSELGTYTLTYTATDVNNNQTVKTREVAVVDTVAPDAELTGGDPLTHSLGTSFSDPGLENLQDNYWSAGDLTVTTTGKVDDFNPGEYELTYRVEDGSGNVTRLSRTVVVEDQTAPTVESTFGDTLALQVNTRIGEVTDQLEISDNFSSAAITNTGGTFYQQFPDGEATRLGTYSLRFEVADDKGNTTTATYTVKVVDRIAPEISLIGPAYTEQPRFDTTAYEAVDSVRVSDNYYTNRELEVTTSGSYFTDYKDTFSRGAYDLTYTVRDPSGNTASVTRTIAIIESTTGIAGAGEAGAGLTVYPNPTEGRLQVALSGKVVEDGRLTVLNALGQQVRLIQDGRLSGSYQVDLSGEQAGMYIIQLRSDDHTSQKRIVLTE
jgi:PKD repeat protein